MHIYLAEQWLFYEGDQTAADNGRLHDKEFRNIARTKDSYKENTKQTQRQWFHKINGNQDINFITMQENNMEMTPIHTIDVSQNRHEKQTSNKNKFRWDRLEWVKGVSRWVGVVRGVRLKLGWGVLTLTVSGSISPLQVSKYFFRSWSQYSNTRVSLRSLCNTSCNLQGQTFHHQHNRKASWKGRRDGLF